ncbi:MAG TPA: Hsp20/alpha crystallin family protein [Anaerolineales bacterium]|nr:Hsp20/alpha crystallin family protein [Anaerolineales bacterium]
MSNLIRWRPMSEAVTLRDAMDRLFDEAFTRPWGLTEAGRYGMAPSVDMFETDSDVVIRATLPGLKAEDVEINVTGEMITIKGQSKQQSETKEKAYHIREQRWGAFERSLALPTTVLSDKAKAEFEDGILTITLPKAEEVRPKTITVKAK